MFPFDAPDSPVEDFATYLIDFTWFLESLPGGNFGHTLQLSLLRFKMKGRGNAEM